MYDIFQQVGKADVIEVGSVVRHVDKRRYIVSVGGEEKLAQAAVATRLNTGSAVVINHTKQGRYIIGTTDEIKSQSVKEVIIDG